MPAVPVAGRTVEQAAAEERDRLTAAKAARWDPVLEVAVPATIAVVVAVLGVAVAVLLTVIT